MDSWKKNLLLGPESVFGNWRLATVITGFEGEIACAATERRYGRIHSHIPCQRIRQQGGAAPIGFGDRGIRIANGGCGGIAWRRPD